MRSTNTLFPVFLKLDALRVLIVGGGKVGTEKLSALLKSCPRVKATVVSPVFDPAIQKLTRGRKNVRLVRRAFRVTDLDRADIVWLATNNRATNLRIRKRAHRARLLVNVADTPDLCDFYMGSVVSKGDLRIGISTNGKSPTVAKRLREYMEEALPANTQKVLKNMKAIRQQLKGDLASKVKTLNKVTEAWLKKGRTR